MMHRGLPFVFSPAKRAFPRDVNHSRMAVGSVTRWLGDARSPAGWKSFFLACVFLLIPCIIHPVGSMRRVAWTWPSGCLINLLLGRSTSRLMEVDVNAGKHSWLVQAPQQQGTDVPLFCRKQRYIHKKCR